MHITIRTISFLALLALTGVSCHHPVAEQSGEDSSKTATDHWFASAVLYEVNLRQFTPEGTFQAMERHLPRLKNLGVDLLCLMPVQPASAHEGSAWGNPYAVADFTGIDPALGTMGDFRSLVDKIHQQGMHVVIDWTPGTTGKDHHWITRHPDWYVRTSDGTPRAADGPDADDRWLLNHAATGLGDSMKTQLAYWISATGIDGFRMDDATAAPAGFWQDLRLYLDAIQPVVLLAGRADSSTRPYFDAYEEVALIDQLEAVADGTSDAAQLALYLQRQQAHAVYFTSRHDINARRGSVFDQYGMAAGLFAVLTYTLDGMPMLASGQEVGLKKALPVYRKDSISWGDHPFNALYDRLGKLRKDNPALRSDSLGGRMQWITPEPSGQVLAFVRDVPGHRIIGLFNVSDKDATFRLADPRVAGTYRRFTYRDREELSAQSVLTLGPWGYQLYSY
ncbi:MAG: alpha-amylase family glycosyl hydrolase [Cyclobacteriaceae bacterium]|nr:alpha-amylase family glycosyl hydrolase [Cyclobacteriaceae bacterium]